MSKMSFESSIEKLEDIVKKLESGDGTLDESLKAFEEAISLVKSCTEQLQSAEQRLVVLTKEEAEA